MYSVSIFQAHFDLMEHILHICNNCKTLDYLLVTYCETSQMHRKLYTPFQVFFYWTLFKVGLFAAAHKWQGGDPRYENLSHKPCKYETWPSYALLKEDPRNIWITWHTLWVLQTSGFFDRKSASFAKSENTNIDCILVHNF